MQIAVSIDNNKEVKILPVTPTDFQIDYPILSDEMDSVKCGSISILKKEGLATVSISSVFPVKEHSFLQPGSSADGWGYVRWFRDNRRKLKPMRVVITGNSGKEYFNRLCSCETFTVTGIEKNGDIYYTAEFKQYRRV